MGFYIQDDFWEACSDLPVKEQNEVFGSLVRLFFAGDDKPPIKGVSKAVFTAFRDRVLLAKKKSDAGKAKHDRGADQDAIKPAIKTGSERDQNDDQTPTSLGGVLNKSESEKEKERKSEKDHKGACAPQARRFAPPTKEEVAAYALDQGIVGMDADRFIDYYAAQGWRLSNGNAMKDWKAAVRNWARRDQGEKGGSAYEGEWEYDGRI